MNKTFSIQELGITVVAKNLNPTTLNLDFLKQSGIIPETWEPARPPVYTNSAAQVLFQSQVEIAARPDRIVFTELIHRKAPDQIRIPTIARAYIATLARAEYLAIGLNIRGHALFGDAADAVRQHLLGTLLSPGPWTEVGNGLLQASMQFTYQLERAQLTLSLTEGTMQSAGKPLPVVLVAGNFSYPVATSSPRQRLQSLGQALDRWQLDLNFYREVVESKFLDRTAAGSFGLQNKLLSAS